MAQIREKIKPTPNRFGIILRQCRERAPRQDGGMGYTQLEVELLSMELAESFPESEPISHSHLSAVEIGRHRLTDPMLRCLIYIYKMDDSTILDLMKLPQNAESNGRPVAVYAQPNTPPQSLPILQLMIEWASRGAAMEEFLKNRGNTEELPTSLTSLMDLHKLAGPVGALASPDPKALILARQKAEVAGKTIKGEFANK